MDSVIAQWLIDGAFVVCMAVFTWAIAATRRTLAQTRATIPPDLSEKYAALDAKCEQLKQRADLTDQTLDASVKAFHGIGATLTQLGRATMKRWA